MLQCNRYPGLDANEIIRLTSAIGQLLPVAVTTNLPFRWPLHSKTRLKANANNSALAAFRIHFASV